MIIFFEVRIDYQDYAYYFNTLPRLIVTVNSRKKEGSVSLFGVQVSLMVHVFLGILGIILAVALFVYVLNVSEKNIPRIRKLSLWVTVSMISSYVTGGWWYVVYYTHAKEIILAGPWKWTHTFFMEWKEHFFFSLLVLSIFLPIVAYRNDLLVLENRRLILILTALIILIGLAMEGSGAIISRGALVGCMERY
jgi:hypothetical protein